LNAVIADTLCEGHRPGAPLLLMQAAPGLLLCDLDGLFPIAVATDLTGLIAILQRLLHNMVLVADRRPHRGRSPRWTHLGPASSPTCDPAAANLGTACRSVNAPARNCGPTTRTRKLAASPMR